MTNFFHKLMVSLKRYKLILDRDTNEDYLHRYYLFIKDRVKFPINLTLHLIVKSDSPIFHDHPWAFGTLILKGGYWEHVPKWNAEHTAYEDVRVWKGPGSIICRKADDLHWLELEENKPATTLFLWDRKKENGDFL